MAEESLGVAAPVETPVAPATPAPDSPAEQVTEAPQGGEPSKPTRTYTEEEHQKALQKRLGIESRRLERVARAEAEAAHYKRLHEESQRPQQQQPQGEPQPKDFQDYESYMRALVRFEMKQETQQFREQTQRETQQERQQRETTERAQALQARLKTAEAKYDDFREVVTGDVPFTQPMVAFIGDSEQGGEVAYYLGNNVNEATRIANLTPAGQFRELVKLEAKLSAPPKPTQTPPPIVPNGGQARVTKDWAGMSTKEHVEAWLKRPKR